MLIRSFTGAAARLVFAVFAIFAFSAAAEAAYITFVASNGNDANPCTVVTAPCKTLQRAYTATTTNGTVRVLTPLQSNLYIAKNITVEGNGAAIVGTIIVSNANAVVTLRGLALNGVKVFAEGTRIDNAAVVHIEDSMIERYTGAGIRLDVANTELFVTDSTSRDNGGGLRVDGIGTTATLTVDNSRFVNNSIVGLDIYGILSTITRTAASGNGIYGIYLSGGTANITQTTAANNNSTGVRTGFYFTGGAGVTLTSSVARGNDVGLWVSSVPTSVTITDCVITSNPFGIENSGALYTRQNNTVGGSVTGTAAIPLPPL